MSIEASTYVCCEHQGCTNSSCLDAADFMPREARKKAKEQGWSRVGGKDYCPDHKPVYKRVLVPSGQA